MIDAGELELLTDTLRKTMLTTPSGAALDAALHELGWADMLDDPQLVALVFRLLGETGTHAPLLTDVVPGALPYAGDHQLIWHRTDRPGTTLDPTHPHHPASPDHPTRESPTSCTRVPDLMHASPRVDARESGVMDTRVGTYEHASRDLRTRESGPTDTRVGDFDTASRAVESPESGSSAPRVGDSGTASRAVESPALAAGRRALGWWLVGTSRTMLGLARAHALDRVQFGKPLAAFQAVRHRLAETLVAVEGAEATLVIADDLAGTDDADLAALLAKAAAGKAALTAAKHCQQVLGGIGFTDEHELHHHVKRALVLDGLLGSSRALTREAGTILRERGITPRVAQL